jgi:hypothetical protein
MDLLITLIGNAAVDPGFRKLFLEDPLGTADKYDFRLTKGDFEIMRTVFTKLNHEGRERMERAFKALEHELYAQLEAASVPAPVVPPKRCMKPCGWSIYPPPELPELRKHIDKLAA